MTQEEIAEMLNAVKEDQENKQSKRKTWGPKGDEEGDFKVRILPPLKRKQEKLFYQFYKNHWLNKQSYLCLNQKLVDKSGVVHEPEFCPICAKAAELWKIAGNDKECDEAKIARQIGARDRYLYRVLVRGSEDETLPVLWESSKQLFSAIVGFMTTDNPERNYGIIVDPLNGRDFIINKKGKGDRSNYDGSIPSNTQSPAFQEKEKIQKALLAAEKLDYSSIFEFVTKDSLGSSLKNYFAGGLTQDTVKNTEASAKTEISVGVPAKEEKTQSSDEAIDDLLKDLF